MRWAVLAGMAALVTVMMGGPGRALGASFTVDATHDAVDAAPGDGVCADAGGACTLRAAVMETNALAGADEITLTAGTYVLSIAGAGEDAAATGDLDVSGDLNVSGGGTNDTIVDANSLDRVIHVATGTVRIANLTIRNGLAGPSSGTTPCHPFADQENGGGVCNEGGDVTLSLVAVVSNAVDSRHGNGVYNAGDLVIEDSMVEQNTGVGHAIVNDGTMTIMRTEVRENEGFGFWNRAGTAVIEDTALIANARGIESWSSQLLSVTGGTITDNTDAGIRHIGENLSLTQVTISNNSGDGIRNGEGIPSRLSVVGSTISGNSSSGIVNGGPIIARAGNPAGGVVPPEPGEITLTNVTISGNGTVDGQGLHNRGHIDLRNVTIAHNSGGGVFSPPGSLEANSSTVNTIVGRNPGGDCPGEVHVNSLGHNLDSDGTCGLTSPGDISNVDPLLEPPADNGGPTLTHMIRGGSPAIDAGDNAMCPAIDQRGFSRPWDANGDQIAVCDIGAVESHLMSEPPPVPCPGSPGCPPTPVIPTPAPESPIALPRTGAATDSSGGMGLAVVAAPVLVLGIAGFRRAIRRVFTQR